MVGTPLRFINFLLDTLIYFALLVIFLLLFRNIIEVQNVKWISVLIYFLYYFLFEYFKGQTIGKILTKSIVISLTEGNNYFAFRILIRTLMRFIPLDIFSYLVSARGLHDWISKTEVSGVNRRNLL